MLFQQMGPPVTGSMPPVSIAQAPSAMLTGGPPGVTQFSRFPVRVHQTYLNQMTQPINMYAQQPLLPIPVHVFQQQQGLSKNLIFPPSYSSYPSSSSTSKHGKKEQVDLDEKNPEAVIDHLLRQDFKHLSDFSFTLMTRIISGIARFGLSTLIRENYPGGRGGALEEPLYGPRGEDVILANAAHCSIRTSE